MNSYSTHLVIILKDEVKKYKRCMQGSKLGLKIVGATLNNPHTNIESRAVVYAFMHGDNDKVQPVPHYCKYSVPFLVAWTTLWTIGRSIIEADYIITFMNFSLFRGVFCTWTTKQVIVYCRVAYFWGCKILWIFTESRKYLSLKS